MKKTSFAFRALFLISLFSFYGAGCQGDGTVADIPYDPLYDNILIFASKDNGVTWNNKVQPFNYLTDFEILPYDGGVYAHGSTSLRADDFRRSSNELRSVWDDVPRYPEYGTRGLDDIEVQARYKIWGVGGDSLRYLEGGKWVILNVQGFKSVERIKFLWSNDQYGICLGYSPAPNYTFGITYTTDGGGTWVLSTDDPGGYNRVRYTELIDESAFLVATDIGILRSTDQGRSWEITSYEEFLSIASYQNSETCFGIDENQQMYRSTDKGISWQFFDMPPSPDSEATSTYYSQIANAGDGVWIVAETNVIYNEATHEVTRYKYYIRRMTGDNLTESSRTLIFDSAKPYYFSFIKADRQGHQVIYTCLTKQ